MKSKASFQTTSGRKSKLPTTKPLLEDLYLPYKPKRRTKAQIAREHGLQPLADVLLAEQPQDVEAAAQGYLNENVPDAKAALDGARAI